MQCNVLCFIIIIIIIYYAITLLGRLELKRSKF